MLVPILALVACFRLPDFVAGVMANPLYIDLGFSKADIANVSKLYGVWIGIIGAFAGGLALTRIGLWWTLLIGAVIAAASNLMFAWLAVEGADTTAVHRFRSASTILQPVSPARRSSPTCRG